jgi:palmitoyltransferase ZDHHC9/14/18
MNALDYHLIDIYICNLLFSCPYLTTRLSPAVPVFAGIIFLSVIVFIFRTACSDPGILPRATADEVLYLERSSEHLY